MYQVLLVLCVDVMTAGWGRVHDLSFFVYLSSFCFFVN